MGQLISPNKTQNGGKSKNKGKFKKRERKRITEQVPFLIKMESAKLKKKLSANFFYERKKGRLEKTRKVKALIYYLKKSIITGIFVGKFSIKISNKISVRMEFSIKCKLHV